MDDKKRPVVGSSFCLNAETDDAYDGGNADADDAGDPYSKLRNPRFLSVEYVLSTLNDKTRIIPNPKP